MTAFFIALVKSIHDAEKWRAYGDSAGKTLAPFGGEAVCRGLFDRQLGGEKALTAAAVIKFPSLDALNEWFESDDYQSLIALRMEAADVELLSFQTPAQ